MGSLALKDIEVVAGRFIIVGNTPPEFEFARAPVRGDLQTTM